MKILTMITGLAAAAALSACNRDKPMADSVGTGAENGPGVPATTTTGTGTGNSTAPGSGAGSSSTMGGSGAGTATTGGQ